MSAPTVERANFKEKLSAGKAEERAIAALLEAEGVHVEETTESNFHEGDLRLVTDAGYDIEVKNDAASGTFQRVSIEVCDRDLSHDRVLFTGVLKHACQKRPTIMVHKSFDDLFDGEAGGYYLYDPVVMLNGLATIAADIREQWESGTPRVNLMERIPALKWPSREPIMDRKTGKPVMKHKTQTFKFDVEPHALYRRGAYNVLLTLPWDANWTFGHGETWGLAIAPHILIDRGLVAYATAENVGYAIATWDTWAERGETLSVEDVTAIGMDLISLLPDDHKIHHASTYTVKGH